MIFNKLIIDLLILYKTRDHFIKIKLYVNRFQLFTHVLIIKMIEIIYLAVKRFNI
jgi:hypothetical protein